jgi:alkaline phosphatase D
MAMLPVPSDLPPAALTPAALHAHATRSPMGRRTFVLASAAAVGAAAGLAAVPARADSRHGRLPADPFTLGVASGDPLPRRVVLWTRLAIDPLAPFGGMPDRAIEVEWQVLDGRRVICAGTTVARPELGHSVHVDARGLAPDREYSYRFRAGRYLSPLGRTRTAPPYRSRPDDLTIAVISCQDWQNGFWAGYADLAANPTDLVVHLGDYIYEYDPSPGAVRPHNPSETSGLDQLVTLNDYRARHALYRTDPALQAAHASAPWVVVWDDHETENNYANLVDEIDDTGAKFQPPDVFARQRAAAYQAYYEHMPLRARYDIGSPDYRIYRRFTFGDLAEFNMLDTRQYRTDQPGGFSMDFGPVEAGVSNSTGTLTGPEQEAWLVDGLRSSGTIWNVLGQQTMIARTLFLNPIPPNVPPVIANLDQWDGYVPARQRLIDTLSGVVDGGQPIRNPVVLTGDIHSTWVSDVKQSFDDPTSTTVATEFVTPSMSSDFPDAFVPLVQASNAALNPHVKYFDGVGHGYLRCTLARDRWTTESRTSPILTDPAAPIATTATWVVEAGTPGAVPG